jgi:serine/threonine-protein kinase
VVRGAGRARKALARGSEFREASAGGSLVEQKQFGRYVIVAELGRGAMGAVFRAVDPLIERDVAVKTLLPSLPPEIMAEVRERFLREARSAGRLNHPNIVTIYDVGEQDGTAYIAMELLEGRSLQDMLRDRARLPIPTIADLVAQVADALDHAQQFGIVHRDVKPANIMVSAAGRAKLTDFGVAHVPSSSMTQTGTALGSPKYMSPEQVTGQPVDPRSDIFSLGVVLYELLVGRTPFERSGDSTVFSLMNRIAAEPHRPVTEIDPAIPPEFNVILDCALAKSPQDRYPRAGDMASDLRNYRELARRSKAAAPAQTQYEKTVVVPRTAAAPSAPAPADPNLLADIEKFSTSFEREQQERLRAEEEERRRKEEELRRWAEAEEKRRQEFERQREATATGTQGAARRTGAIDMLRQRAAGRAAAEDKAKKAEIAKRIDSRLRAAFRYLSEFTTVMNEANPASERSYGVMYFGDVPGLLLGDGFTDYRTREIQGKECVDHVTFKYKVRFANPAKVEVSGEQLPRVQERLNAMHIKYDVTAKRNDFGQVARATLVLSGPFPCQAVLRGDYDDPGFALELINVRRYGPARIRLGLEELTDDVLDEFGTYVLGADDGFERLLKRR